MKCLISDEEMSNAERDRLRALALSLFIRIKYEEESKVEATKVGKGRYAAFFADCGSVSPQRELERERDAPRAGRPRRAPAAGYPRRPQPYTKMPSSITKQINFTEHIYTDMNRPAAQRLHIGSTISTYCSHDCTRGLPWLRPHAHSFALSAQLRDGRRNLPQLIIGHPDAVRFHLTQRQHNHRLLAFAVLGIRGERPDALEMVFVCPAVWHSARSAPAAGAEAGEQQAHLAIALENPKPSPVLPLPARSEAKISAHACSERPNSISSLLSGKFAGSYCTPKKPAPSAA